MVDYLKSKWYTMITLFRNNMNTIGVVAGSFDPITKGHEWLISEAARLVDRLHVVIGVNPAKRYLFSDADRRAMVEAALEDLDKAGTPTEVHFLRHDLLIHFAVRVGATHLIRGIRDTGDFNYETQMALVNRKIAPEVKTVYLVPPPELAEVSSSTVRGLVGFTQWEQIVSGYVHPTVLDAFRRQQADVNGVRT